MDTQQILTEVLPVVLRNRMAHSFLTHISVVSGDAHIGYVNPIYDGCGAFRILYLPHGELERKKMPDMMLKGDEWYIGGNIAPHEVDLYCEPASDELVTMCEHHWIWTLPGFLTQEESEAHEAKFKKDMIEFRKLLGGADGKTSG